MRFEDLDVWKRAARLSADIYRQLKDLRDYGFRDQITRSGLSISSNIAEGFERMAAKEKLTFLYYAKGSCGELRSQKRQIKDQRSKIKVRFELCDLRIWMFGNARRDLVRTSTGSSKT
jgi:four helix bundle protein